MSTFTEEKKLKLFKYHLSQYPINIKDPFFKLLSNYDELLHISELKEKTEILYFSRVKADEILKNDENDICLNYNLKNNIIPYLFYMCLLVNYNSAFSNYSYDINYFIEIINNYFEKIKKESENNNLDYKYTSLITSKMVIDLINNSEDKNDELINIKKDYISTIINIIGIDKLDLNKRNIETITIEQIYSHIICSLIKENKFKDYEYSINILNQLNIENITITEAIEEELFKILNEKELFIKKNEITNIEDIFDKNKTNFYYILLKYILKNSIYIYKIPFLFNTRKVLIKKLKYKLDDIFLYKYIVKEEKINYIIKNLLDSNYYYNKCICFFLELLKEECEESILESKIKYIKKIDDFINNQKGKINNDINLKDFVDESKIHLISPLIRYILENKNKENIVSFIIKDSDIIDFANNNWENIEKLVLEKKLNDNKKDDKLIIDFFIKKENEKILLKIFPKDIYSYYFEQYKTSSINLKISSYLNNNRDAKGIEEKEVPEPIKENILPKNYDSIDYEMFTFVTKENIKYMPEFIKELDNSEFIIGGNKDNINFMDNNFKISKKNISIGKNNFVYNICLRAKNEDNTGTKIIICSEFETSLLIQKDLKITPKQALKNKSWNCVEVRMNNHIICEDDGAMHYINLFDMTYESSNKNIICNESLYRGAIQITKDIVALTSNQFLPKGEDKLIFYNIIPRKVYKKKIYDYSFNISPNGLTLISNDKNDYIILLCACKKYYHRQKNGILLVIFDEENIDFETKFYHTENFEVYCFCQLYQMKENIIKCNDKITDFFLVGGFESNKGKGIIKLYKIEYSNDNKNIELIFIQDILSDIVCNGTINCIIQTREKRNIIFTCTNGYIYILNPPNLSVASQACQIRNLLNIKKNFRISN